MHAFARRIINWQHKHGRHNLPWQTEQTAYRVWLSEVMLQQTQVATVIPYFDRFIAQLPTIQDLANADLDHVLSLWSGLGYYSRARNLHKAAKQIQTDFAGEFPNDLADIMSLAGIGRSTAGAIASLALQQPTPILDGNVKRVLMRHQTIDGWYGKSSVMNALWQLAESLTPHKQTAIYNQGMMDLGSMICTRSNPQCELCPVQSDCQAYKLNVTADYPNKKTKAHKKRIEQRFFFLIHNNNNELLLYRRPNHGIWGGLWSLPECSDSSDPGDYARSELNCPLTNLVKLPTLIHQFSHFQLNLIPIRATTNTNNVDLAQYVWYKANQELPGGLAAPIATLMRKYAHEQHDILQTNE